MNGRGKITGIEPISSRFENPGIAIELLRAEVAHVAAVLSCVLAVYEVGGHFRSEGSAIIGEDILGCACWKVRV